MTLNWGERKANQLGVLGIKQQFGGEFLGLLRGFIFQVWSKVQFSSVARSCPTLWDPMDCSTPGVHAHNQIPKLVQTHVYQVGDALQPSYSVVPFSSHLQSFPVSGSFPMSHFFTLSDHSTGVSASASVLPMNIQNWLPLGLSGLISLQSKTLSRVFSNTTVWKHQFFCAQLSVWSNSHIHTRLLEKLNIILQARILEWVAFPPSPGDLPNPGTEPRSPSLQVDSSSAEAKGKTITLTRQTSVGKVMPLLFNMLVGY